LKDHLAGRKLQIIAIYPPRQIKPHFYDQPVDFFERYFLVVAVQKILNRFFFFLETNKKTRVFKIFCTKTTKKLLRKTYNRLIIKRADFICRGGYNALCYTTILFGNSRIMNKKQRRNLYILIKIKFIFIFIKCFCTYYLQTQLKNPNFFLFFYFIYFLAEQKF
jgi:hypothetical protein